MRARGGGCHTTLDELLDIPWALTKAWHRAVAAKRPTCKFPALGSHRQDDPVGGRGKNCTMALHPDFPRSPYEVLLPEHRWFPAAEEMRATAQEKLLPPLVARIRQEVMAWRNAGYAGASTTSRALLAWWFETDHQMDQADGTARQFRYYFAQREAVETVIWLYEV